MKIALCEEPHSSIIILFLSKRSNIEMREVNSLIKNVLALLTPWLVLQFPYDDQIEPMKKRTFNVIAVIYNCQSVFILNKSSPISN